MPLEAGAIVWRIQSVGANLFKRDLEESEKAAEKTSKALKGTTGQTDGLDRQWRVSGPRIRKEVLGMSESTRASAREVGTALALVGAAIVAVTALTVHAAVEWETAWTGVTKTIDAPAAQLDQIQRGLRDLTKDLPASHEEIAAVAEAAGQLGVRAGDIVAFTKTMIDLGETTNLTADEAATSLAQLMNVMGTAPGDVGRLGAAVVALGNNGASTERDIVQMSQRIAGAAKIIGLSEGETLGLANALASVGIEADAGGSSVSQIMIDIANAVSQKGPKLLEWAKLAGLSADEFAEKYRTKPAEAIALVIEGMGTLAARGGDVFKVLSNLGQTDVRVTRSLLGLANSGDMLRKSLELGNKAWAEQTALQIEAEKRYATTAAKLEMARNAVVDAAIDLGGNLLPAVEAVSEGVRDLAGFFGDMPSEVQGTLASLTLAVGGIVLVGGAAIAAVPKIVAFRVAVRTLATDLPLAAAAAGRFAGFMGGPWGVALTAAVAGLMLLNDWARSMQASSDELSASMRSQTRTAETIFATYSKGAGGLTNAAVSFDRIQESINAVDDANNPFAFFLDSDLGRVFGVLRNIGDELGDLAKSDLPGAQKSFREFVSTTDGTEESQWRLLNAFDEYKATITAAATANGDYLETMTEAEKRQVILNYAVGEGVGITESAADAYTSAAKQVQGLYDDLDRLIDLINTANGENQDAVSANADYRASLEGISAEVQRQKDAYAAANGTVDGFRASLDENTAAGAANADMLAQVASDAQTAAEKQFNLDVKTMSADEATRRYLDTLGTSKQAIIDQAIANGLAADQVQALIDRVYKIPSQAEVLVIAQTAAAASAMDTLIASYEGRRVNILATVTSNTPVPDNPLMYANGGRYPDVLHFAGGGENHVAQFAAAGSWRVWAEDETGGEWYIPRAPAKRARSTQVLADVADDFGYALVPKGSASFADGSPPAAVRPAPAGRSVTIIQNNPVHVDPIADARRSLEAVADGLWRDDQ